MAIDETGGSVYFIGNDVQQRLLTLEDAIEATERAYLEWDRGSAAIRPKTNMYVYNEGGDNRYGFSTMEGGSEALGLVAIRIKSDLQPLRREVTPPGASIPTSASKGAGAPGLFCGLVYVFSARTGAPLAILNDGHIQHVRVAASAALAAKHLAREDAEELCILGSQWMARSHAPAMCAVRPIKRVKVFSPNREHRQAFADEMSLKLGIEVVALDTAEEAVSSADIVCCCTNSFGHPVLSGEWIADGTFVSNVLSAELGEDAMARIDYTVKNQPLRDLGQHVFQAGSPPPDVPLRNEGTGWLKQVDDDTPLLSERQAARTGERPGGHVLQQQRGHRPAVRRRGLRRPASSRSKATPASRRCRSSGSYKTSQTNEGRSNSPRLEPVGASLAAGVSVLSLSGLSPRGRRGHRLRSGTLTAGDTRKAENRCSAGRTGRAAITCGREQAGGAWSMSSSSTCSQPQSRAWSLS